MSPNLGEREGLYRRLLRRGMSSAGVNAAGLGLGFLAQLALARILGSDAYGIYAYVFAWLAVLAPVSGLGLQGVVTRYVAAYREQSAWATFAGVLRFARTGAACGGAVAALLGLVATALLTEQMAPAVAHGFWAGLPALPFMAWLKVEVSVAKALGLTARGLVFDVPLREAGLLVTGLALGGWWGLAIGGASMLAVLVVLTAGGALALNRLLARQGPEPVRSVRPSYDWRAWLNLGFPYIGVILVQQLNRRLDIIMVGALVDPRAAGFYAVASRLAKLVDFPLGAVNHILTPTIAALHAKADKAALQDAATRTVRMVSGPALLIAGILAVVAAPILGLFGDDFTSAATALRILLVGHLIALLAGSVVQVAAMTGHQWTATSVIAAGACVNAGLNLTLIPLLGLEGAALGAAAALIFQNGVLSWLVYRRLGIVPSILGRTLS